MIEDKFGAELLALQPPAAFRPPGCRSWFPLHLHSALPAFPTRSSPPTLPPRPGAPWGLWADPSRGADRAGVPPFPLPRPQFRVEPPAPRAGPVLAPPLPHTSPPLPHQPVAQPRCSVPAPSWSLPHLPTPTGRSTGGKRAPGPPDQTAPAVLLKVRGTREGNGAQEAGSGPWG